MCQGLPRDGDCSYFRKGGVTDLQIEVSKTMQKAWVGWNPVPQLAISGGGARTGVDDTVFEVFEVINATDLDRGVTCTRSCTMRQPLSVRWLK